MPHACYHRASWLAALSGLLCASVLAAVERAHAADRSSALDSPAAVEGCARAPAPRSWLAISRRLVEPSSWRAEPGSSSLARAAGALGEDRSRRSHDPDESGDPSGPSDADSSMSSVESADDCAAFDDLACEPRAGLDGQLPFSRDIESGVSLGGRALSRLEDNRCDKPPRRR